MSALSTQAQVPDLAQAVPLSSQRIAQEMEKLIVNFQPEAKHQPAQTALKNTLQRTWKAYGKDLLHCYDMLGLPPDNLKMESLFGKLRRHQRRISGRKSTRELRDFGQYQILCLAESEAVLLEQIRKVPVAEYQRHRLHLAEAEVPRQFFFCLHRDPVKRMQHLADQYSSHFPLGLAPNLPPATSVLEKMLPHTS